MPLSKYCKQIGKKGLPTQQTHHFVSKEKGLSFCSWYDTLYILLRIHLNEKLASHLPGWNIFTISIQPCSPSPVGPQNLSTDYFLQQFLCTSTYWGQCSPGQIYHFSGIEGIEEFWNYSIDTVVLVCRDLPIIYKDNISKRPPRLASWVICEFIHFFGNHTISRLTFFWPTLILQLMALWFNDMFRKLVKEFD